MNIDGQEILIGSCPCNVCKGAIVHKYMKQKRMIDKYDKRGNPRRGKKQKDT